MEKFILSEVEGTFRRSSGKTGSDPMEVPTFTGDKLLALVRVGRLPSDQREALRRHIIVDHEFTAFDAPEFTNLCLAHLQAMEAGNRHVSALIARHLP